MYKGNKILKKTSTFLVTQDTNIIIEIEHMGKIKEIEMKMPYDYIIKRDESLDIFNYGIYDYCDDCDDCHDTSIEICDKCSDRIYRELIFIDYLDNPVRVDLKTVTQITNDENLEYLTSNNKKILGFI